jgi:hypothetical protein
MARATTYAIGKAVGLGALMLALNSPLWATTTALPSGHQVELSEVIWGSQGASGSTVRFRFIDEKLGARVTSEGFVDAEADMAHLCNVVVMPDIKAAADTPDQVIISISDRFLPLGDADPEIVQLFEAYRVENDACVWEGF